MKNISLPKKFLVEEEEKGRVAKVIIEPCFPGYGLTLGNALRRVMLSSLPGGAVTAVKIKGVNHEFSTLKNISEDVVEIILNLKKLRVKVYGDEPVVLRLKAKGEKAVTGADIETSADAEIINKNQHLATLNSKDAELEMELTVAKGIGYVPTEERDKSKDKTEIGFILVDSIFTPVIKIGLEVVATRVGQRTDYDKIIFNIETDGTINPEDAVKKAAEILINQFSWVVGGAQEEVAEVDIEAPVDEAKYRPEAVATEEAVITETATIKPTAEDKETEPAKKRGRPKKVAEE